MPKDLGSLSRFVPGAVTRHERRVVEARSRYNQAADEHALVQSKRIRAMATFMEQEAIRKAAIDEENERIEHALSSLERGE